MHLNDDVTRISPRSVPLTQNGNLCGSEWACINLAIALVIYFHRVDGFVVGSVSSQPAIEVNHICELLYHGAVTHVLAGQGALARRAY